MINLVRDQRVKTATADLYASLILARSEAITRNRIVAMCAMTDDGWGCQNSPDWARGWIVFLDPGTGVPGATTDILKRQDKYADVTLTGTDRPGIVSTGRQIERKRHSRSVCCKLAR